VAIGLVRAPNKTEQAADPTGSAAFGALNENFVQGLLVFFSELVMRLVSW